MALSEDLPLYRDAYRLLNNLLALTQDFPRFFRYSMGSRMVDLTLDMLSLIHKTNSSYEKVGILTEFLDSYRMLRTLFRICAEQKVITERRYASFGRCLRRQASRLRAGNNTTAHHLSFPTACIIPPISIRIWANSRIFGEIN